MQLHGPCNTSVRRSKNIPVGLQPNCKSAATIDSSKLPGAQSSRRQLLSAAASVLLAPILVQQANARTELHSTLDSSFKGFDGLGGSDSDYATAEV